MASFTAPFLIPLFLGMTFDARNTRPGVDIYDTKYVDDPMVTEYHRTNTFYKVVTSQKEVVEALDISGDLSLKIKSGMINLEGKGSYLKEEKNYNNMVEILTRLDYTSKTKFFKEDAKPRTGWASQYTVGVLGTHYVTSVTYGAEMIASARFVAINSSDTEDIKGAVNGAFGSGGSGVDLAAEGKLEKLAEQVKDKATLEISYYGTVPLKSIPNSIEGLRELILSFKAQMDEADMKDGIPISVELSPLTAIAEPGDEDKFQFMKNRDLEAQMSDFEEYLDELRQSRLDTSAYAKSLPYDLEDKYTTEVGHLLKTISDVLQVFYEVIWTMDLTKGSEQLRPATDAYDNGVGDSRRFGNKLLRIKKTLSEIIKPDGTTGATYIHYGNNNCTADKSTVLYEGFTVSSAEEGIGGTSQYDCVPKNAKKGYELTEKNVKSNLAGIRYTKLSKEFNPFTGKHAKKIAEKGIPCAKCYASESSAVVTLTATYECPGLMKEMYKGYVMSARTVQGFTSEYICVDREPSEAYSMDAQDKSKDTLALTTIHSKGALPSNTFIEGALIRCVVCSM